MIQFATSFRVPEAEGRRRLRDALVRAGDESGSLTIFGLFILVIMLMVGGLAVDLSRYETTRVKLQGTLDRSVLAAASLSQRADPETVVRDFFEKSGLSRDLRQVNVVEGLNHRQVSATAIAVVDTLFLSMLGTDQLVAPASGTAEENRLDVEIALVLDISGSMAQNQRLPRLKTAAKDFVDAVLRYHGNRDTVSLSIVPFSTQVAAGHDILSYFDVSDEHDRSACIDFSSQDFEKNDIAIGSALKRTGHFDPFSFDKPPSSFVCPIDSDREIVAFSNDAASLKTGIDALEAEGNTSIDLGAKWGAFLLDPSSRDILDDRIVAGSADRDFDGRPVEYGQTQTMKVLIVMSDGQNTDQYMLRDAYNAGRSRVWRDPSNGRMSVRDETTGLFYIPHQRSWSMWPYDNDGLPLNGRGDPVELTYPELWAQVSVPYNAYSHRYAMTGDGGSYYRWTSDPTHIVTGDEKDDRTTAICGAVKARGVMVFTIGFEAGDHGDAVLRDCASSPAHFFDVEGLEISQAFSAISSMINQLRLSQ